MAPFYSKRLEMGEFQLDIIAFLLVIGPLILFHELGHFIGGKLAGITIEEFGIGFPPRLVKLFSRGGTDYTLNWIPLGGFVKPLGEDFVRPTGEEIPPEKGKSLQDATPLERIGFFIAGPAMNVLVAIALLTATGMVGMPVLERADVVILEVNPGSPADIAGLQAGDIVRVAGDEPVRTLSDLSEYINANLGREITLTVERDGEMVTVSMVPRVSPPQGQGPTGIVIQNQNAVVTISRLSPGEALLSGVTETALFIGMVIAAPIQIIQGTVSPDAARPVSVVGISQMGGDVIAESIEINAWYPILRFAAAISIALGLTNLLPIPALDGGRILFVLIELVRGKRMDPKYEGQIHLVGLVLLFIAMAFFVLYDLMHPITLP